MIRLPKSGQNQKLDNMLLVQQPDKYLSRPKFFFVENPVKFQVESSTYLSQAGVLAHLTLKISNSGDNVAGHNFILAWGNYYKEFFLANVPDESGTQLPVYSTGLLAWANGIVTHLTYNADLASNFKIYKEASGNDYLIHIVARKQGSSYSLSFINNTVNNLSIFSKIDGSDKVRKENYKILLQVLNRDTDEILGEDISTPDDEGFCNFDIRSWLKAHISTPVPWGLEGNVYQLFDNELLHFTLRMAEGYGGKWYKLFDTLTYAFYALAGGLSKKDARYFDEINSTFFEDESLKKHFLTHSPITKKVAIDQPERLAFLLEAAGNYTIRRVITFTDLSIVTLNTNYTNDVPRFIYLYLGHDEQELSIIYPSKQVKEFSVQIYAEGSPWSEKRTFIIDRQAKLESEYLFFRNSFNRFDTIRLAGKRKMSQQVKSEYVSRPEPYEATVQDSSLVTSNVAEVEKVEAFTAWLSDSERSWLRDLGRSEEIYRVRGSLLERVLITSSDFVFSQTDKDLTALKVTYQVADINTQYSNLF